MLRNPRVLLVLAMSVLGSASLFCVFTYVTPTLETVTGISPRGVTIVLMLDGVAITIGNLVGGALSDWRPIRFLVMSLVGVLIALTCLYFAEPYVVPMVVTLLIWGGLVFAAGTPLQARIAEQASAAPNLASTLNQGAFNLGNASGAMLGGMLLTAGFGYRQLPLASIVVTLCMLALALVSAWLDHKHRVVLEVGELIVG